MQIEPFGVEEWMNAWETKCEYNLAETCVASLTIEEMLSLAGKNEATLHELLSLKMTYGAIEGSMRLRTAIAGLFETRVAEDVLVCHGAIGANALVYQALVEPDDRVVSIIPSYQQHTSIPASLGAEVVKVPLREDAGWRVDFADLAHAAKGAKLITLTNPNNPTGALMDATALAHVVEIAEREGAYVLCDEVYRGTDQAGSGLTASIADIYPRGISTGSMSKAFSLAGLRLGWMVAPDAVRRAAMTHRDYNTISVGVVDDHLATIALEAKDRILARSRDICRGNLALLDGWVRKEPKIGYVMPASGTVTLLRYDLDMPSYDFCVALLKETGVLFTPGSALGVEGTVRIGYANTPKLLEAGLVKVSGFLAAI